VSRHRGKSKKYAIQAPFSLVARPESVGARKRALKPEGEDGARACRQRCGPDSHLRLINEHGRMNWQKTSGYNRCSKVEAAIDPSKRVIGEALRSRESARRVWEVKIAVKALNRMLELGGLICVRVAE
jgi:hypothetical protein